MAIYPKVDDIIDALIKSGGILKGASEILKKNGFTRRVERHYIARLMGENPRVKEAVETGISETCDIAHTNLKTAINSGDLDTSKWYLSKLDKRFQTAETTSGTLRILVEREVINGKPASS
jgi:hypothetical protein